MNEIPGYKRRSSVPVKVGDVTVGGDAPIVVQSMTNTDTVDEIRTAIQVADLARAGSELVRITVNNEDAARAVPRIRQRLDDMGVGVPLVGDFHFNGHRLLKAVPECASALAKLRINPGNVGKGSRPAPQFAEVIELARDHDRPVRIGVNWGSLEPDLLNRLLDQNARRVDPKAAEAIIEASGGGVDVILDHRLDEYLDLDAEVANMEARVMGIGEAEMDPSVGVAASSAPRLKNLTVKFMKMFNTPDLKTPLEGIAGMIERDELVIDVAREYTLEEAGQAHHDVMADSFFGKLINRP